MKVNCRKLQKGGAIKTFMQRRAWTYVPSGRLLWFCDNFLPHKKKRNNITVDNKYSHRHRLVAYDGRC